MDDRQDLGGFLKARRARITPEAAGLRAGTRRRVAGLRREELAHLAGISVEYYQRLEQGRARHPSDAILDALADALSLTPTERDHLRRLARPPKAAEPAAPDAAVVRPELASLLGRVSVPAMVVGDRFDVLALNPLARRLFGPFATAPGGMPNLARFLFLDPAGRDFYVEWDDVASATVGQLRSVAGRFPADRELARLLAELREGSLEFAGLWARGDVAVRAHGTKSFRHPAVGVLTFRYENLELPGDARQRLVTLEPEPDGPTEAALQLLTSWAAPDAAPDPYGAGRPVSQPLTGPPAGRNA
ncbi:helix-turn-helix domain-containing protein [Yinghuangia seranimata]|uniref:helix-turn-helix domain-containing protein n=1 Tax=Yinghuangia seranimata TaxID=408067 RepID=UPI00248BD464|nr:helix-turn-helix transcriptional regulator [Yinghuangia seranimata]MDI2126808.1 helix-turn-helix transcriptional regulator [Yinghuangia seranimata]